MHFTNISCFINNRREGERVIDRSKLNLEIPRKPSVSSSTTNSASSTSSTPTFGPSATSFSYPQKMKPKRPRSISPTQSHPSQPTSSNNNNNNTSSIAGRGISNYSEPSSSKYPRADYGPPSSTSSSHSRNSSNGSIFSHTTNVLPEKPQVRYPGGNRSHHNGSANDDHYHRTSKAGSGSGSGSSGNLLSLSSISSLSGHGANGGGNSSSYRQQHSSSYHPQGPARGGFGMRGRGGYFGHGEGGLGSGSNGSGPISLLGPPGRPLPFNRNMMQMPHTRGPFHSRLGFGRGGGGGDEDGRGRGRGGIGRHPSSPRGEWPRRRSRD